MDPKGDRMRKIKLGMLKLPDSVLKNNSTIQAEGNLVKMAGNSLEGGPPPRPKPTAVPKTDPVLNSADIPLPSNADIPLPSAIKSANIPLPALNMLNIPLPAKLASEAIPLPSDANIPLPSDDSIPLPADKPPQQQREGRRKITVQLDPLKPDELECRSCWLRFTRQQEYDQHLQSEEHQQAIKAAFHDGRGPGNSLVINKHEKRESPSHDGKSAIVSFIFKKTVGQKISSTQPFYRRDDRNEKTLEMVKFLRLESAAANEQGDASGVAETKTEFDAENHTEKQAGESSPPTEDRGPKLMCSFVKVQSKEDNGKLLDWPKEMIMYTRTEPKISYCCNPLCFDFSKLFPGKINRSPARASAASTSEHDHSKADEDADAAEQDKSEKGEDESEKKKSHKKKKKKKHKKHKDKEGEEGKADEAGDGDEASSKHKKKKKKRKKEGENEGGKENAEDDGAKKKHKKSKKKKRHSHHGSEDDSGGGDETKTGDGEKPKHKRRKKKKSKKRKKKHHHSASERSDADVDGKGEEKGSTNEIERKEADKHGNISPADESDTEKIKDEKNKAKKKLIHRKDIQESVKPDIIHPANIKIPEKRKLSLGDAESDSEQLTARLLALSRTKVPSNAAVHLQKKIKKEPLDMMERKTPSDRKRQTSESSVNESTTPASAKKLKVTPKAHTTVRDSIPTATIAPVVNIKTEKQDDSWSKIETSTAENIKSKWDTSDSDTENVLDKIVKKPKVLKKRPVVQGPANRPLTKLVRTLVKTETETRRTVTVNPLTTQQRLAKSNVPMANISGKKPLTLPNKPKSSKKSVSRSPIANHSSRSRSRSHGRGRSYSRSSSRSRSRSYSSSSYSERESRRSGRHKRRKHSRSRSYSRSSTRSRSHSRSRRRRKRSSSYSDYSRSRSRSSSRSRSRSRSHRRRRRSYTRSRSYSRSYSSSRSRSRSRRRRRRRKRKRRSKSHSRSRSHSSIKTVKISPKKLKKVEKKKEPVVDPGEIPLPDLSGKKEDELSAEKLQKLKEKKPRTDVGKTVAELVDSLPSDIPLPGQGDGEAKTVSSDALPNGPTNTVQGSDKSFIGPLLPNNPNIPPPPPPPGMNMGPPRYPPQHGPPGPAHPGHGPGYWDSPEYWDGPGGWDGPPHGPPHGPGPRPPYRGMRPMYDYRMRGPPPAGYEPRMRGPSPYMNRPRGPGPHGPPGPGYMGNRHPGGPMGHYGPPRGQMPPDYYNDNYDCYNDNYNENETRPPESEPEAPPKKESPPPLPPAKAPSPKPPPPKKKEREPTPNPDIGIPPEQVEQYKQLQKKAAKHARRQIRRQQKKELGEPEEDSSSSEDEKEDETASVATAEEEIAMMEEAMMPQLVALPMNAGQRLVMAQPQMMNSPAGGQFFVAQGAGGQQILLQQRPQPQLMQAGVPLQAGQPMIAVPQGHSMVASAAAAAAGAQPAHIVHHVPTTQIMTMNPAVQHMQSMMHIQQLQQAQAIHQAQAIQQAQAQAQVMHAHQQAAAAAAAASHGPIIVDNHILVPRLLRPAL